MNKRKKRSISGTNVWAIIMALSVAVAAMACGDNTPETAEENTTEQVEVTGEVETTEQETASEQETATEQGMSIQDEIAEVEAKAKEHEDSWDSSESSQSAMNNFEVDSLNIWDEELNSLWERLTEEVTGSEIQDIEEDQKLWESERTANSQTAGLYARGGSMQPMLEAIEMEEMTHERVYFIAGCLAEARGESFTVPADIQKQFDARKTLDQTFEALSGEWVADDGSVIVIVKDGDNSENGWTVSASGGNLSEQKLTYDDVYGYCGSDETIMFKADSGYIEIEKAFDDENTLIYTCHTDNLDDMLYVPMYEPPYEPVFCTKAQ